jgi:hypothetical protein
MTPESSVDVKHNRKIKRLNLSKMISVFISCSFIQLRCSNWKLFLAATASGSRGMEITKSLEQMSNSLKISENVDLVKNNSN